MNMNESLESRKGERYQCQYCFGFYLYDELCATVEDENICNQCADNYFESCEVERVIHGNKNNE